MSTPAEQLTGLTLDGGWIVIQRLTRSAGQTGGAFSCSYIIEHPDGTQAFLKAMDFQAALGHPDPALKLKELTEAFVFERTMVELCGDRRLSRVIRAHGSGKVNLGPPSNAVVQYLIFEIAEGDVRKQLSAMNTVDLVWRLRCLQNVFVAVKQLHSIGVAHQDVKPSNVLGCSGAGHKIADLGRAWHQDTTSPFDKERCAGDRNYAPPELLYSGAILTEDERRNGADFYALGSMVVFMFTGFRMTATLMSNMNPSQHWRRTRDTYQDVLPQLQHAFARVISELRKAIPNDKLYLEAKLIVEQMCNPDISKRGDSGHKAKVGSRFNIERFISKLSTLIIKAEIGQLGIN